MSPRGSASTPHSPKNHSVKHNQSGSCDSLLFWATDFWISSLEIINNPDREDGGGTMGCQTRRVYRDSFGCFQQWRLGSVLIQTFWRFILWIFVASGGINCGKMSWRGDFGSVKEQQRERESGANRPWSRKQVKWRTRSKLGPDRLWRRVGDISQIRIDHKPLDAIPVVRSCDKEADYVSPINSLAPSADVSPAINPLMTSWRSPHRNTRPPSLSLSLDHLASRVLSAVGCR